MDVAPGPDDVLELAVARLVAGCLQARLCGKGRVWRWACALCAAPPGPATGACPLLGHDGPVQAGPPGCWPLWELARCAVRPTGPGSVGCWPCEQSVCEWPARRLCPPAHVDRWTVVPKRPVEPGEASLPCPELGVGGVAPAWGGLRQGLSHTVRGSRTLRASFLGVAVSVYSVSWDAGSRLPGRARPALRLSGGSTAGQEAPGCTRRQLPGCGAPGQARAPGGPRFPHPGTADWMGDRWTCQAAQPVVDGPSYPTAARVGGRALAVQAWPGSGPWCPAPGHCRLLARSRGLVPGGPGPAARFARSVLRAGAAAVQLNVVTLWR